MRYVPHQHFAHAHTHAHYFRNVQTEISMWIYAHAHTHIHTHTTHSPPVRCERSQPTDRNANFKFEKGKYVYETVSCLSIRNDVISTKTDNQKEEEEEVKNKQYFSATHMYTGGIQRGDPPALLRNSFCGAKNAAVNVCPSPPISNHCLHVRFQLLFSFVFCTNHV